MKFHKSDRGTLVQVDMKWVDGRPNPVYKCSKCGTIIDSANWQSICEEDPIC